MFNMRIDVVRQELERRFRDVEKLKGLDDKLMEESSNRFIHFLLTESAIRPFIIELTRYDESFLNSDGYNQIVDLSITSINNIIAQIDKANFIDQGFKEKFETRFGLLGNFLELPNPDTNDEYMSVDQFLAILRNADVNKNLILNGLESTKETILNIFTIAGNIADSCDQDLIKQSYGQLDHCINVSVAYIKYKAQYIGAVALQDLLLRYSLTPYIYLSDLDLKVISSSLEKRKVSLQIIGMGTSGFGDIIDNCRQVYHAVDKYLMTGKSKSALINRLKTYCTWFKLEEFWKDGIKESDISKIIEEYIFSLGYYPIVNARAGRSIYDILADTGENLHWDNSVLIELKQYIGDKNNCTESSIKKDIAQAQSYLSTVKSHKHDLDDMVYLLVFYDGDTLLDIHDSLRVPNVQVEFIYVGKNTPSKLKQTIMLGQTIANHP